MIKTIKIKKEDESKVVFVSDLHLNQGKQFLLDGRNWFTTSVPFTTFEEHDEWIFREWEKHLSDKIVFNLGDAVFRDSEGKVFEKLSQLPSEKHYFLWGNHNSGAKQCYFKTLYDVKHAARLEKFDLEIYPLQFNNITFCGTDLKIFIGKQEISLSHFPKRIWDNMSDKRQKFKNAPKPAIALSGHSHGSDTTRNVDWVSGKSLDVGVENAIKYDDKFFFTWEEVRDIVSRKSVVILDHHKGQENPS